jgi:hypothetical protein
LAHVADSGGYETTAVAVGFSVYVSTMPSRRAASLGSGTQNPALFRFQPGTSAIEPSALTLVPGYSTSIVLLGWYTSGWVDNTVPSSEAMVSVPVRPASSGNVFWKTMRIVGTSTMQIVVAAPNWNVGGKVVVAPGTVVVTAGVVVVVSGAVVVVAPVVDVEDDVVVVAATVVVVVAAFVFGTQSAHIVVVGATVVVVTADVLVVVVGGGVHGPACNVCVGSVAEPTTMVCTTLPGNDRVKLTPNVTCGPPLTL